MRILKNLEKNLPMYARRKVAEIAQSIEDKANRNLANAIPYLSDVNDMPAIYSTERYVGNQIIAEINLSGSQVAFLEFGTGITTERYPYDYENLKIAHSRGSYGQGKGTQNHWAFVPKYDASVSKVNGDYEIATRVYHRKRDGGISIYPLKKTVIITKGLPPMRVLYNAIEDTRKELKLKK